MELTEVINLHFLKIKEKRFFFWKFNFAYFYRSLAFLSQNKSFNNQVPLCKRVDKRDFKGIIV